jgi:hypothetical protein
VAALWKFWKMVCPENYQIIFFCLKHQQQGMIEKSSLLLMSRGAQAICRAADRSRSKYYHAQAAFYF